jgi:hypothetical protein
VSPTAEPECKQYQAGKVPGVHRQEPRRSSSSAIAGMNQPKTAIRDLKK